MALAITNTSGSTLHSGALTITGTDFGTKTTAAPLRYDNFESGTIGEAILGEASGGWGSANSVSYSNTQVRTTGGMSAKQDFTDETGDYNAELGLYSATLDGATKIYVSGWFYITTWGDDSRNIKLLHAGQQFQSGNWAARIDLHPSIGNNGAMYVFPNCPADEPLVDYLNWETALGADGSWHRMDSWFDLGTPNTANGHRDYYVDNIKLAEISGEQFINGVCSGGFGYLWFGHYFSRDGTAQATRYWDELYVDTARSRIEIGNNSDFDSCTHREIQIPTSWSTTSIGATVNQGSFANDTTVWLFVVDEDGDASPGYEITIGATLPVVSALQCEGETTPGAVTDTTPEFSAYVTKGTNNVSKIEIQVSATDNFAGDLVYDSGSLDLDPVLTASGRTDDKSYGE